jgi:NADPH:quinone reductase-like Zn-dependent oxidoreductase
MEKEVAAMTENTTVKTLEVRKDKWRETRVVESPLPADLGENEVFIRVDKFAITANNISYAGAGDLLGYWGFFPAEEGWGRIPAMGWGDVIASAHPNVQVGERVWGFFPFSTHLKIVAGNDKADQFQDVSAHRAEYAPVYARFDRASANPIYDVAREDQDSLLRGLFMTSWLVEDFMRMNASFGADTCLITSASSKTSIALAYCVKKRGAMTAVGLTSPGNVAFCESLGYYDRVLTYDAVSTLDASQPAVIVDMAGSAAVLSDVHHHYGDNMKHSCQIGATHYEEMGAVDNLPGATPEFFFAPSHIQTRSADLGASQLMMNMGTEYVEFRAASDRWLTLDHSCGEAAVEQTYQAVLAGKSEAKSGQIVSMWPAR